ncbi:signal peptide peptidase SppA [Salipaludibacillus keqinensis]|uniref:Signal peptide peptidase SppA n=1 Tax=Salipaludibacillus keqinensis TaxID=2045207 RepID=A0A323TII5_9BACI|nr:signal peptide peptidase SppA [Salipaludibacillus keqinensis]PYZ93764.1 signal peptide peptidase SppA [Salipaludibacillus keqinensis]
MNLKRWIALSIAAVLFVASLAVSTFTTDVSAGIEGVFGGSGEAFHETTLEEGSDRGKLAVIHLNGVIQADAGGGLFAGGYDHRLLLEQLDHAAEDPEVHGVVLRVNTPGGGVVESDEIHDKVKEIQEDFRKPVYVSMGSMAASGGYYVAAPADQIYANPQTITGSLGVIMQQINVSELAEEWGINAEVIKSGPYKDIMSSTREMSDDEREILQSLVDDAYDQFVHVIEEGRQFDRDEVLELADGRIYTGSQALDVGLIDGLGHLEDVIDEMKEDLDRGDISVVEYEANVGFPALLGGSIQQMVNNHQLTDVKNWFQQNQGPQLMYLYTN